MTIRLLQILFFFLPLHGLISVFDVPYLRFWKEGVLILIGLVWFLYESTSFLNKKSVHISLQESLALCFLLWLLALVFIADDTKTALVAARYLGLGLAVFFLISRLKSLGKIKETNIAPIISAFLCGVTASVFFGIWAHFLGGYEILQSWYSQTISSWVPGQTIPLYHETAGIIRMQGASSGPVEFAHLLLFAFMVLPIARLQKKTQGFFVFILLLGMVFSLTRAVWLALFFCGAWAWFQQNKISFKKLGIIFATGVLLFAASLFSSTVQNIVLRSESTQEHFSRPLEVFKIGLESPFLGNLGKAGPAARAYNLQQHNNDKAPVAENVFIDVWAQTGMVGIFLFLGFFGSFFFKKQKIMYLFLAVGIFVANLASIFDMTPVSISYFLLLGLLFHHSLKPSLNLSS